MRVGTFKELSSKERLEKYMNRLADAGIKRNEMVEFVSIMTAIFSEKTDVNWCDYSNILEKVYPVHPLDK